MPFQPGNKLGSNSKDFQKRMRAAIEQDDWKRVRTGIERILDLCSTGERWALELVRDTLDGRPAQSIVAQDEDGKPLAIALIAYAGPKLVIDNSPQLRTEALPAPDPEGSGLRH